MIGRHRQPDASVLHTNRYRSNEDLCPACFAVPDGLLSFAEHIDGFRARDNKDSDYNMENENSVNGEDSEEDPDDEYEEIFCSRNPEDTTFEKRKILTARNEIRVDLERYLVGPMMAGSLANQLEGSSVLEELLAASTNLGFKGVSKLARAFTCNKGIPLRVLDISGNHMGDMGAKTLAGALAGSATLEVLRVGNNRLTPSGIGVLTDLVAVLPVLRVLDLDLEMCDYKMNGQKVAASVANALNSSRTLQELGICGLNLRDAGAALIAQAVVANKSLVNLHMANNYIGEQGAGALGTMLMTPGLQLATLVLNNNGFGEMGVKKLAEALVSNTSLSFLDLDGCGVGDQGAVTLAKVLQQNRNLTHLRLSGDATNTLSDDEYESYADGRTLVRAKDITDEGLQALADAIVAGAQLQELRLRCNRIGPSGARILAAALLETETLRILDLETNLFGDEGAQVIARALSGPHGQHDPRSRPQCLEKLVLKSNRIGKIGASALADMLPRNLALRHLDLSKNAIRSQGLVPFGLGLRRNDVLQKLLLDDNGVGTEGTRALAAGLSLNKSLQILSLNNNPIGPDGAEVLAEALRVNLGLVSLFLEDTEIQSEGGRLLLEAVKDNGSLEKLVVSYPFSPYYQRLLAETLADPERRTRANAKRIDIFGDEHGESGMRAELQLEPQTRLDLVFVNVQNIRSSLVI